MKSAYEIIVRPHITEKSVALSYGDSRRPEAEVVRSYTFVVATTANKLEVKWAIEQIYNTGKKKTEDHIVVDRVTTVSVKGKSRRVGNRPKGKKPDWKKAIVTLAKGQALEDYGV